MCAVSDLHVRSKKKKVKLRARKGEDEVYVRFKPIPQEDKPCDLDFSCVDEIDGRGYGESLVLIFCRTHGWESRWVDDSYL
jgi:hypothetical protein